MVRKDQTRNLEIDSYETVKNSRNNIAVSFGFSSGRKCPESTEVSFVDLVIGRRAGTIILAHRMDAGGIAERRQIVLQRARVDGIQCVSSGLANPESRAEAKQLRNSGSTPAGRRPE
jgi:hypothetical protein